MIDCRTKRRWNDAWKVRLQESYVEMTKKRRRDKSRFKGFYVLGDSEIQKCRKRRGSFRLLNIVTSTSNIFIFYRAIIFYHTLLVNIETILLLHQRGRLFVVIFRGGEGSLLRLACFFISPVRENVKLHEDPQSTDKQANFVSSRWFTPLWPLSAEVGTCSRFH